MRAHVLFTENKPQPLPEINATYRKQHKVDQQWEQDVAHINRDAYLNLYKRITEQNAILSNLKSSRNPVEIH